MGEKPKGNRGKPKGKAKPYGGKLREATWNQMVSKTPAGLVQENRGTVAPVGLSLGTLDAVYKAPNKSLPTSVSQIGVALWSNIPCPSRWGEGPNCCSLRRQKRATHRVSGPASEPAPAPSVKGPRISPPQSQPTATPNPADCPCCGKK